MNQRSLHRAIAAFAIALPFPIALLQSALLTGVVRNAQGTGIANVNIDVLNPNGSDPNVSNDTTGPTGAFSTTVDPSGVYTVLFKPPPPPTTTFLVLEMDGVNVTGTTNLGTVTLENGVSLSGRVLSPNATPLAGVNIDIWRYSTGQNIVLQDDTTDSQGMFTVAAPLDPIQLRIDPSNVGQNVAPAAIELDLSQNTNLGNIQLETGFLVTAIVRRSNGTNVANADFDVYDSATGDKLYTPNDNTNASGFADFVVPSGTYDIEICPPAGELLVSRVLPNVNVSGNTSLGVITLQAGFQLSGTIVSHLGPPVEHVDVDVKSIATGDDVPLCNDDSDASGHYAVVVPAGTFKVKFSPPYDLPLAADIHQPVTVNSNTVLNGVLPHCDFYTNTGSGTPGAGGFIPTLTASGGTPRLGNHNYTLVIGNGRGGAKVVLRIRLGACPIGNGWAGGPSLARDDVLQLVQLSGPAGVPGVGTATFTTAIPGSPEFIGLSVGARAWVVDSQAGGGLAASPNLCGLICE